MLGGISVWQLVIVLAIVVLIFGTKKLRNVGGDLGGFIRNFKSSMKDGEQEPDSLGKDTDAAPDEAKPRERSDAPKSGG